jgi:hypothetical protein
VLEQGANEITIEYSKLDAKTDDTLEILIESKGYPQPLLRLENKSKASDKVIVKITIEAKPPLSFKPIVISDVK